MDKYTSDLTYKEQKYNDFMKTGDAAEKMTTKPVYVPFDEMCKRVTKDEPTCACEGVTKNALPIDGTLTFTGYPDEILRTLRTLLDGRKIEMTVDWTVIDK